MPGRLSEDQVSRLVANYSAVACWTPQTGCTSKGEALRGHTPAGTPRGGLTRLPVNTIPPRFTQILDSQVTAPCRSDPDLAVAHTAFKLGKTADVRQKRSASAPTAASLARKVGVEVPGLRRPKSRRMAKAKGKENVKPVPKTLSTRIPKDRDCARPLPQKPIKSGKNSAGKAATSRTPKLKTKSDELRHLDIFGRKIINTPLPRGTSITNKLQKATTSVHNSIHRMHTKLKPTRLTVPPKGQSVTKTTAPNQCISQHAQPDLAPLTRRIDELVQTTTNLSARLSSEIVAQKEENRVLKEKLRELRDEVAEMFFEWEVRFDGMGKNEDVSLGGSDINRVPQRKRKLGQVVKGEEGGEIGEERQKEMVVERPRKRISGDQASSMENSHGEYVMF